MNKLKLAALAKGAKIVLSKHSPEILTGIGIAGMITATILAVKVTPKALRLIEEKEEELGDLPKTEVVKACWKCYIPAAVTGTTAVACLVGASKVSLRRNAALATAYKLSETALSEYKDKVIETIGEKKEHAIRDAIAKDKVDKKPIGQSNVIVTGRGESLCYDPLSDRYFYSDMERLKKAANDLNSRMFDEMNISLNEFYDEIGLKEIAIGSDIGWDINKGDKIDLYISATPIEDVNSMYYGRACLVIEFNYPPKYDFR